MKAYKITLTEKTANMLDQMATTYMVEPDVIVERLVNEKTQAMMTMTSEEARRRIEKEIPIVQQLGRKMANVFFLTMIGKGEAS